MERTAGAYEQAFVDWAKDHPEVLVMSADLTSNTEIAKFRDTYPDRFYTVGIAEQNMTSWAGGLAREGFVPFLHTFAVFIYRLSYDQVAMSIAYPNLKVRFVGCVPGVTTPGGVTHQAIEDIGVMRALPNMNIVEPGDITEMESVARAIEDVDGPVYMRVKRGLIPRLFPADEPMQFGKVRELGWGDDLAILSSGICTEEAMMVVAALRKRGVSITHLHVNTYKPFDDLNVPEAIARAKHGVITIENHSTIGGLGTCTAEVIANEGLGKRLHKLGIQDRFMHGASQEYLMRKYELDARALLAKCEQALDTRFDVSEDELTPEKAEAFVSMADQL